MSEALGSRARTAAVPALDEARRAAMAEPASAAVEEVAETHTFAIKYVDRRGHQWAGNFSCHIPSIRERIAIGRAAAALRGGVPPEALDAETFMLTDMLAQLTIVLDQVPPWAAGNGLQEIKDANVVGMIYKEVRDHAQRFWGPDPKAEGAGDVEEPQPG